MRKILLLIGTVMSLFSACDDAEKIRACSCDREGAQRCNGNDREWCIVVDGCLEWSWLGGCNDSPEGPVCEMHGEMAACVPDCTDECQAYGDTVCSFDVLMTCTYYGGGGCMGWAPSLDCTQSGLVCRPDEQGGSCVPDCEASAPAAPGNPSPADAENPVDPDTTVELTWDAAEGAASYAVYLGDCPPPAYPDAAFVPVTEPALPVTLAFDTASCWQVVALSENGCATTGDVWTFETGARCLENPSCENALERPSPLAHFTALDLLPLLPPPISLCSEPRLRLAVDRVMVHEKLDDLSGDIVYCVISVESQIGGEIRVLPLTSPLDAGGSFTYSLNDGVFWGQPDTLMAPGGNLMITYDCFESDDPQAYADLLDSLSSAALSVGGTPGAEYGWVFTSVGAVAQVTGSSLGLDSDDYVIHAQQVIATEDLYDLIPGVWWSVRRTGTINASDWDWELFVTAWGCVDNGHADQ